MELSDSEDFYGFDEPTSSQNNELADQWIARSELIAETAAGLDDLLGEVEQEQQEVVQEIMEHEQQEVQQETMEQGQAEGLETEMEEIPPKAVTEVVDARTKNVKKSARCGGCRGCQLKEDCKNCVSCRDMVKHNGPGIMKQGCRKKICSNPLKKTTCKNCEGCLTKKDCQECAPCKDMKRHGGPGKLRGGCEQRACSEPLWLSKVGQEEQLQAQIQVVTLDAAGDHAEEIKLKKEDLGFATTTGFTPFPARINHEISAGDRILVTFYVTGEGAFISGTDWQPYTLELVQQLLDDSSANRSGFGRALGELQADLYSLEREERGEEQQVFRPSTTSSTMLGAPRKLGPVSSQGMMEDAAFNTAAFQEKMFKKGKGKYGCKQCPNHTSKSWMEARRHARACGQRPQVPRQRSQATKYACSAATCPMKFASILTLNKHYKSDHQEHCRPRRCSDCRKVFVDEEGLKVHRRASRCGAAGGEEKIFPCPYCPYTSDRKFNLEKLHVPRRHSAQLSLLLLNDEEEPVANHDVLEEDPMDLSDEEEEPGENSSRVEGEPEQTPDGVEDAEDFMENLENEENDEDNEDQEDTTEVQTLDPIMKSLNSRIKEMTTRTGPGLGEYEQVQLNNLIERRERWKQELESNPLWKQLDLEKQSEFEKQPKTGKRKQHKMHVVDIEEKRTRKSSRLIANQIIVMINDDESNMDNDDDEEGFEQQEVERQEIFERERQMLEEREVELEQLETTTMITSLVATIVNCVLGEQHKCEICGQIFRDKFNLEQQHMKALHTPGQQPISCTKDFCQDKFPTKYEMFEHRKGCRFTCPNCQIVITRCGRMEGHLKKCTGLG